MGDKVSAARFLQNDQVSWQLCFTFCKWWLEKYDWKKSNSHLQLFVQNTKKIEKGWLKQKLKWMQFLLQIIAGSFDRTIKLFDARNGKSTYSLSSILHCVWKRLQQKIQSYSYSSHQIVLPRQFRAWCGCIRDILHLWLELILMDKYWHDTLNVESLKIQFRSHGQEDSSVGWSSSGASENCGDGRTSDQSWYCYRWAHLFALSRFIWFVEKEFMTLALLRFHMATTAWCPK